LKDVEIGSNVIIRVPDVDRGPLDARNCLAVIVSQKEGAMGQLFKLGTSNGRLEGMYTRNRFEPCASNDHIIAENVPDVETTLRMAVSKESQFQGQGFLMCNCQSGCKTDKCRCKKMNMKCSTKCHNKLQQGCKNK
jgi:hypothetical protein